MSETIRHPQAELATQRMRLRRLRPADAPWPSRDVREAQNRRLSRGDAG